MYISEKELDRQYDLRIDQKVQEELEGEFVFPINETPVVVQTGVPITTLALSFLILLARIGKFILTPKSVSEVKEENIVWDAETKYLENIYSSGFWWSNLAKGLSREKTHYFTRMFWHSYRWQIIVIVLVALYILVF